MSSDITSGPNPIARDLLRTRYGCNLGPGGWCDGTPVGARMRCPHHSLTKKRERLCDLGLERLDEDMHADAADLG